MRVRGSLRLSGKEATLGHSWSLLVTLGHSSQVAARGPGGARSAAERDGGGAGGRRPAGAGARQVSPAGGAAPAGVRPGGQRGGPPGARAAAMPEPAGVWPLKTDHRGLASIRVSSSRGWKQSLPSEGEAPRRPPPRKLDDTYSQ
eukprot:1191429-Prorocentrum_minimum.AAC.2